MTLGEAGWAALGVAGTFLSIFVMHRLGKIQISLTREANTLNATKATIMLGTAVHVDKRQENPPGFPPFYYLIASVYNEGELPAKQLKGYWKLYSPTKSIKDQLIPIGADFLGSSPLKLESHRLDDGINGAAVDFGGSGAEHIRINVDFELDYIGIPDDQTHHYSAQYHYDHASRQIVRT